MSENLMWLQDLDKPLIQFTYARCQKKGDNQRMVGQHVTPSLCVCDNYFMGGGGGGGGEGGDVGSGVAGKKSVGLFL